MAVRVTMGSMFPVGIAFTLHIRFIGLLIGFLKGLLVFLLACPELLFILRILF